MDGCIIVVDEMYRWMNGWIIVVDRWMSSHKGCATIATPIQLRWDRGIEGFFGWLDGWMDD